MIRTLNIQALIKAMLNPAVYPEKTSEVELVQTQMSLVFLTDKHAYKVKKPVDLGYLDYTTLNNRHHFCLQELQLNRRLSPEVYLEVVPITLDKGNISLAGRGNTIEYAVKIQRLPMDMTMEKLLPQDRVTPQMLEDVARRMADFHREAATGSEINRYGSLESIIVNIEENREQSHKYIAITLSEHENKRINDFNASFTAQNKSLLQKRMDTGRIRDCHGDLHAAHVCFTDGIVIFDCIEFNDRFRYCDVASEIAFLAMDIERFGRPDLSKIFTCAYVEFSHDADLNKLLNFYKCYRACVRGKVESFKYDDRMIAPEEREKALKAAKNYFHLAYGYTRRKPVLVLLSGLMGTGKSTLARAMSGQTGFSVLSSDSIRKNLAGVPLDEHRYEKFDTGIYSAEHTENTYTEMLKQAGRQLQQGQSVILDASFKKREERKMARRLASQHNADLLIIECILEAEQARSRLQQRMQQNSVSDGRWEIFMKQKEDFDTITEFPAAEYIKINTAGDVAAVARPALERI
ncbi:MAG TPA: AAA family ATPase [Dehalococcoidia bacterium]|nr:AAA family ATPase [Dehalococcoidia bacterium]